MSGEHEKRSRKAVRAALVALDGAFSGRPLAAALSEALRAEEKLGPQERRAAALAARGVVRELRRIDLAIARAGAAAGVELKKLPVPDRNLLRYLALRVSVEGEAAARPLQELALPGPRRPRSLGDDLLAKVAQKLEAVNALPVPPDPIAALAHRRSVPDFLARRMVAQFGLERADGVLEALNRPTRLDLRVNRLLAARDEVEAALKAEGVLTHPLPLVPDGLVAEDRSGLFGKAFQQGRFELPGRRVAAHRAPVRRPARRDGRRLLRGLGRQDVGARCGRRRGRQGRRVRRGGEPARRASRAGQAGQGNEDRRSRRRRAGRGAGGKGRRRPRRCALQRGRLAAPRAGPALAAERGGARRLSRAAVGHPRGRCALRPAGRAAGLRDVLAVPRGGRSRRRAIPRRAAALRPRGRGVGLAGVCASRL
ncbi:MAG: hypothetical protein QM765_46310 [Myxococcales bacterium]